MKVNYRNNSKTKVHIRRMVLLAAVLIVGLFFVRPLAGAVVSYVNGSVYAIQHWFGTSADAIPSYIRDRDELRFEITELESSLARLDGAENTINNLVRENRYLHSLLHSTSTPRIVANVVTRPPQLPYDTLLIDSGSDDGVHEGALVYVNANTAIGTVLRVFPQSALVALASSPGIESSVYVFGPDVYATAVGQGGGVLEVQVPQGFIIETGNLVVVPALGAGLYGALEKVISVPTEPVQYGFVTTAVPLQSIRAVTVDVSARPALSFADVEAMVAEARVAFVVDVPDELLINAGSSTATSTSASTTEE